MDLLHYSFLKVFPLPFSKPFSYWGGKSSGIPFPISLSRILWQPFMFNGTLMAPLWFCLVRGCFGGQWLEESRPTWQPGAKMESEVHLCGLTEEELWFGPGMRMALQGARISVGALWCVSSFKSEEEQLKCQVVLKHPTGRSGTYMQFKLEGRDVCVPRANWRENAGFLICCKWRWALSWVGGHPQETRQQERDLAVGVGLPGGQHCSSLLYPPPTKGKGQEIQFVPPGYQIHPLCSKNKWIMQVLIPRFSSTPIYWVLTRSPFHAKHC